MRRTSGGRASWCIPGGRARTCPEGLLVDTDLRWLLLSNLARLGLAGEAEIAAEQQRDPSVTGAEQAAGSRAAQPTAAAKAEAWRLAVETDEITNTVHQAICLSFWLRGQDEALLPYVDRYFAAAEDISALRGVWADKGGVLRKNALRWLFPWPMDKQAFLDRLDPWLTGAPLSDAARRVVDERRDDLVRALRCQAGRVTGRAGNSDFRGDDDAGHREREFDAPDLLGFLGKRTIAGVEAYAVEAGRQRYARTVCLTHGPGMVGAGLDRTDPAGDHAVGPDGPGRGCRSGPSAVRRRCAGPDHRRTPEPVRAAAAAGREPARAAGAGHGRRGRDGLPDHDRAAGLSGRRCDLRGQAGGRVRGAGGPARPGPDPAVPHRRRPRGR